MLLKGIKALLYNDGYTIRGVQKVIKENGTKKLLQVENENKLFTVTKKDNKSELTQNAISNNPISETKRTKLMNVLNDLISLRKKLDN